MTRWIALGLLVAQAVAWAVPSNVFELIAREQPVLLGRYSRSHFYWLLGLLIATPVVLYVASAGDAARLRRRTLRLLLVFAALLLAFVPADVVMRWLMPPNYVLDAAAYHRTPGLTLRTEHDDVPAPGIVYPNAGPGYGVVRCTLTTDRFGFRNPQNRDEYDLIALGDSFTEGSRVSDDQTWPARLERLTGAAAGNFGMSGYSPARSLAALRTVGLGCRPRVVLLLLYEGNDFRATETATEVPTIGLKTILRSSPLLVALERGIVRVMAGLNATPTDELRDRLSWLPIEIRGGERPRYYAFAAKQLNELFITAEEYAASRSWQVARQVLADVREECRTAGARLVVVYAPVKARVVVPLVIDRLPIDKVRDFVAVRSRRSIPTGGEFVARLRDGLGAIEEVVRDRCERDDVAFISLTGALRRETAAGRQLYYSYDQHWTPIGHDVVATEIRARLIDMRILPLRAPAGASAPADSGQLDTAARS